MTDQSESQSGPNREAPVSSAGFRPFGMIPMFNMVTTKFRGKDSDISLGEWKSNLQTTFALQGVPVDFRAELTLCCLEGKAKREILILAPEKRNSPELIFNELSCMGIKQLLRSCALSSSTLAKKHMKTSVHLH